MAFPRFGIITPLSKLSQYDMVLAVSQDALNTQWSHLYHTRVGKPAEQKFLIPHTLTITSPNDAGATITGTILSPTLDLNDIDSSSVANRTIRLNFKFIDKPGVSSFTAPIVQKNPQTGETETIHQTEDIHGWTFSFEASIGGTDIQKILEDGLNDTTRKALSPYVDSTDFLASSVYCLFETSQIIKTVRLRDADNKEPEDSKKTAFIASLSQYFTKLNGDASEAGKHPYVLGYTVRQKSTHHVEASEMIPKSFQMSTTTDNTQFSTLNFLMLERQDTIQDPKAGLFNETFYTKSHQTIHNGFLGISSEVFMNKYIVPDVISHFQNKPMTTKEVESTTSFTVQKADGHLQTIDFWKAKTTHDDAGLFWRKFDVSGLTMTEITYSSLGQTNPGEAAKPDSIHVLTMRVKQTHSFECVVETSPHGHFTDDWWTWSWDLASKSQMKFTTEFVFTISPGEDGKLIPTYRPEQSTFPPMNGDKIRTRLIVFNHDPNPTENSVPVSVESFGFFSIADFLSLFSTIFLPEFSAALSGLIAENYQLSFKDAGSQLAGISNKVIMPAGDVLTFAGIDSDDHGNVYCAIDYRSLSDGSVETH